MQNLVGLAASYARHGNGDLLSAVEQAMDFLNWQGDEAVDDVAELVLQQGSKKVDTTSSSDLEAMALERQQQVYDRLAAAPSLPPYSAQSTQWSVSSSPTESNEWQQTLKILDTLHARVTNSQSAQKADKPL